MAAPPRSEPEIPDEGALSEGLLSAFGMFITETDLHHAVGETGVLRGSVEVFMEKGRARHSKGVVSFERRVELGGRK